MNKQQDEIHDLLIELADYGDSAINHVDRIETEIERIVSEYVAGVIPKTYDEENLEAYSTARKKVKWTKKQFADRAWGWNACISDIRRRAGIGDKDG